MESWIDMIERVSLEDRFISAHRSKRMYGYQVSRSFIDIIIRRKTDWTDCREGELRSRCRDMKEQGFRQCST